MPSRVFYSSGRGDMGSLVNRLTPPRFSLAVPVYLLASLRVVFTGGSGSALLQLKVDSRLGPSFDRVVYEFPGVGTGGANVEFRIDKDERDGFLFYSSGELMTRDELVLVWTDPDSGKLTNWAVCAELEEVS